MPIALVQLSDFHIKTGSEPLLNRADAIVNAIASLDPPMLDVILLWTGDLTYSGTAAQFESVSNFIRKIESGLRAHSSVKFLGSSFIPGNHDCDFSLESDARSAFLASPASALNKPDPRGAIVQQMTAVQDQFFAFMSSMSPNTTVETRITWRDSYTTTSGVQVEVRCCNTAWVSQLHEEPAKLVFPVDLLAPSNCALTLSILHHPYGWMAPDNAKAIRRFLETDSSIIFTGHEHDGDTYSRVSASSNTQYVEGAALHAENVSTGFQVAILYEDQSSFTVWPFIWRNSLYRLGQPFDGIFAKNQRVIENTFQRSQEHERDLVDLRNPYTHPRLHGSIKLTDLYIYPDLTKISLDKKFNRSERVIADSAVLEELYSSKFSRISAPSGYGKSALAQTLCRDLLDRKGCVAVLANAEDFTSSADASTSATVDRLFSRQYSKTLTDNFRQLEAANKAIVIDDWHLSPLNAKGRETLFRYLRHRFSHIILLDDTAFLAKHLEGFFPDGQIEDLSLYEIKEFGYRLRGALASKWHNLGQTGSEDAASIARQISASEKNLTTLIGRGILPSTPLYILSALQMQDEALQRTSGYGSFGHVYQTLVTERLVKVDSKSVPLAMNYLAAIAYRQFELQAEVLNEHQVDLVHREYVRDYAYSVGKDSLLESIAKSGLISYEAGEVGFRYKYAYFFFVATAFKNKISDEDNESVIRGILSRLASESYFEKNAQILIFFLYLSKDRRLIQEILVKTRSIFRDAPMCNLESDLSFVNMLLPEPPVREEPAEDTESNLMEFRASQDEAQEETDSRSMVKSEDGPNDLDHALRSLEIMGQVLRNFPTNLKGDLKVALVEESYFLGFRMMGAFLGMLSTHNTEIEEEVIRRFSIESSFLRKEEKKRQEIVRQIIVHFAHVGIFSMIKKLSSAVGSEELVDTYVSVRSKMGEAHIATRLVDLSIRLDHFGQVPDGDMHDLEKSLRGNPTGWALLQLLMAQYIALVPVKPKLRQEIVRLFKLRPNAGLQLSGRR